PWDVDPLMAARRLKDAVYKIRAENLRVSLRESLRNSVVMGHCARAPSVTTGLSFTVTVAPVNDAPRKKSELFFPPTSSLFPTATYTFPAAITSWRNPWRPLGFTPMSRYARRSRPGSPFAPSQSRWIMSAFSVALHFASFPLSNPRETPRIHRPRYAMGRSNTIVPSA